MGAWGCGSDENDETYDTIGLSINHRIQVVEINESGRRVMAAELVNGELEHVGVVVWFIKQGALVPLPALREAVEKLLSEKEAGGAEEWGDNTTLRLAEIDKEVALLNRAIEAGGMIDATGVKSIASMAAGRA